MCRVATPPPNPNPNPRPTLPLPPAPPRPAAEADVIEVDLLELLAGAPPTLPPTHEEICQMADLLMAEEPPRSVPCQVCKGKRVDVFGGDCVGCGGVGVVPVA